MKKETGSAHVVLTICVIIALLFALGWIFWQNFVNKDTTTQSPQKITPPTVRSLEASIDKDFDTKLSFSYPENWKYSETIQGEKPENWGQKITVTSPSGKYVVSYEVGVGGGLGGACDPKEVGTVRSVNKAQLTNFKNVSYGEVTFQDMPKALFNDPKEYTGKVALFQDDQIKAIKKGSSYCDTIYADVIELGGPKKPLLYGARLTVANITDAQELSSALNGKEYQEARSILMSTND